MARLWLLLLLAGPALSAIVILPDEEDVVDTARRTVREANPESFADYFRKLQLAQSELSKNASVGEAEIEKVFKNHGLDTQEANSTTVRPATDKLISSTTDITTTDEFDGNSTTEAAPSTTELWWGVSRKSRPKHLKSTIARSVVNKIKTSRRRSHFD